MNWLNIFSVPNVYLYSPLIRLFISILILLFGIFLARKATAWARRAFSSLLNQKQVVDSPLGEVIIPARSLYGTGILSSILFAIILFFFISIAGEVVGITFFSQVVALILNYIPNILSALIVLVLGVVVAGIVERVVKQQVRRLDPNHAFLYGTATSSTVLVLFVLMAVAELGIAREFIMILFGGVVFAFAIAAGLAFGLGSKNLVQTTLESAVENKRRTPSSEKKSER